MDQEPVSVIIPCYNYGHFLTEAVLSVLQQTHQNTQIIIVNDGSADDTQELSERLIEQYQDRSIALINKENGGLVSARRAGVEVSSSDYLLFLDADDMIHPRFISETLEVLKSAVSLGFVYTTVQHIGARSDIWSGGPFHPEKLLFENQLACTALMKREMYKQVGGFKEEMDKGYEDWEFWISCVEQGWVGRLLDKPYFYYRKHKGESMLSGIDSERQKEIIQKMVSLHKELYAPALARAAKREAEKEAQKVDKEPAE